MQGRSRLTVLGLVLVLVLGGASLFVGRLGGDASSGAPGAGGAGAGGPGGGQAIAGGTLVDVTGSGVAPEVGKRAPDFTAETVDGEVVSLSQFRGRPVWLTFGATWCASCRVEAPDIQAAYEEAGDAVVLAVYLSERADEVRTYAERVGMTFTHVPDPDERIAAQYHVIGVPQHYFIDRDGVVRSLRFGVLSRGQMDAELDAIAQ